MILRISLLVLVITSSVLGQECTDAQKTFVFTPCTANQRRYRVQIPGENSNCKISSPVAPSRGLDCGQSCPKGQFLNMNSLDNQMCQKCPIGSFSTGDILLIKKWNSEKDIQVIKITREINEKDGYYTTMNSSIEENVSKCSSINVHYAGKYLGISTATGKCSVLMNIVQTLTRHGNLELHYELSDRRLSVSVDVQPDSGHAIPSVTLPHTSHLQRKKTIKLPSGHLSIQIWVDYRSTPYSEGDVDISPFRLSSLSLQPVAFLSQCTQCEPGFFSNSSAAEKCFQCPRNTYTDQSGQQACTACPTGQYSEPGAATCLPKPACEEADYHFAIVNVASGEGQRNCEKVFNWTQPKICENGVNLPVKVSVPCPLCNPGMEYLDKPTDQLKQQWSSLNGRGINRGRRHLPVYQSPAFAQEMTPTDYDLINSRLGPVPQEHHGGIMEISLGKHHSSTLSRRSLCRACPERQFSPDGIVPCKLCPNNTAPLIGHFLSVWQDATLPPAVSFICVGEQGNDAKEDDKCRIKSENAWLPRGEFLLSNPRAGVNEVLIFSTKIGHLLGDRGDAQLTIDFVLQCTGDCSLMVYGLSPHRSTDSSLLNEFTAKDHTKRGVETVRIDAPLEVTDGRSQKVSRTDEIAIVFQNFDIVNAGYSFAKIFRFNLTHVATGSAVGCQSCLVFDDKICETSCRPGTTQIGGRCVSCPAGSIRPSKDQAVCVECPKGLDSNSDRTKCVSRCKFFIEPSTNDTNPFVYDFGQLSKVFKEGPLFSTGHSVYRHNFNLSLCSPVGDVTGVQCGDGQEIDDKAEFLRILSSFSNNPADGEGKAAEKASEKTVFICRGTSNGGTRTRKSSLLGRDKDDDEDGDSTVATNLGDTLYAITDDLARYHSTSNDSGVSTEKLSDRLLTRISEQYFVKKVTGFILTPPSGYPDIFMIFTAGKRIKTVVILRCDWTISSNETSMTFPPQCPDSTCDGRIFWIMVASKSACPVCRPEIDFTQQRGECVSGQQKIFKQPSRHCVLAGFHSMADDDVYESCPLLPRAAQIGLLIATVIVLLCSVVVCHFYKRSRRLEYKYMKLVAGNKGLPTGPGGDNQSGERSFYFDASNQQVSSCALDDDEEDDGGEHVLFENPNKFSSNRVNQPIDDSDLREIPFQDASSNQGKSRTVGSKFLDKIKKVKKYRNVDDDHDDGIPLT